MHPKAKQQTNLQTSLVYNRSHIVRNWLTRHDLKSSGCHCNNTWSLKKQELLQMDNNLSWYIQRHFADQRVSISLTYFLCSQNTIHQPSRLALSSSDLFSIFGTTPLDPCFLSSSTDNLSPSSKTFSSPYQTLWVWRASCCSSHQTLAREDYEMGRANRPLICSRPPFLQAAAPTASQLPWKDIFTSKHLSNRYRTFFGGWYPYVWENAASSNC